MEDSFCHHFISEISPLDPKNLDFFKNLKSFWKSGHFATTVSPAAVFISTNIAIRIFGHEGEDELRIPVIGRDCCVTECAVATWNVNW